MDNLILFVRPSARQANPITRQDLLVMQTLGYETFVAGLRRLHPSLHRAYLVHVLTIVFNVSGLDELPIVPLAELMFATLDSVVEPRAALGLQNIIVHVSHHLEGAFGTIQ